MSNSNARTKLYVYQKLQYATGWIATLENYNVANASASISGWNEDTTTMAESLSFFRENGVLKEKIRYVTLKDWGNPRTIVGDAPRCQAGISNFYVMEGSSSVKGTQEVISNRVLGDTYCTANDSWLIYNVCYAKTCGSKRYILLYWCGWTC